MEERDMENGNNSVIAPHPWQAIAGGFQAQILHPFQTTVRHMLSVKSMDSMHIP